MKWKVWFWVEVVLFVVLIGASVVRQGLQGHIAVSLVYYVLAGLACYDYAYQKALWRNLVWKLFFALQAVITLISLFIFGRVWMMLAHANVSSAGVWVSGLALMAFLVLVAVPTYRYAFGSKMLWNKILAEQSDALVK